MHILFLTDNFPPEVNAPASRTYEHCREWVKAGHKVTVVTCTPNFPKGKVYVGYKNRLWQSEIIDGICVIRVWSYIVANEGFFPRILDYVSYMTSAIFAAPFVRNVGLVIGTSPHFFTACAAYSVSRYKRIPFIFELRDLWPETIKAVGALRDGSLIRLFERIVLHLYRKAARIICVTHSFREVLIGRGIDPNTIDVITNGVDLTRFHPMTRDKELAANYGLDEKFVAGYVGTHGLAHGLSTLLETASRLQNRSDGDRFRLLLLGDGAMKKKLLEQATRQNLKNVVFIDSVPKDEVTRYWSLIDASIIHLKKSKVFTAVIPSKLFEAMAMGIPVLHGVEGESAELVRSEDIGLTFEPENAAALCDALIRLAEDGALRNRLRANCAGAAKRYDRQALARKMLAVLVQTASEEYCQ